MIKSYWQSWKKEVRKNVLYTTILIVVMGTGYIAFAIISKADNDVQQYIIEHGEK